MPQLHIVVADPLRPGHELRYYPGEANVRMADVVVINKVDSATAEDIATVRKNVAFLNPSAKLIEAASEPRVGDESLIRGKAVLVVEDGPSVTHGGMKEGVGAAAARRFGARELVDPRPAATGSIREVYQRFPGLGRVLPAMGYSRRQMKELGETIEKTPCDSVVLGTPIDLARLIGITKPTVRVTYELRETAGPKLDEVIRGLAIPNAGRP